MIFYRLFSIILLPFLFLLMVARIFLGKDDASRIKEKFAFTCKDRPKGKLIWIHGVSVGESRTALILVDKIVKYIDNVTVLMTSTTLNSAQMLAKEVGDKYYGRVIHQFLPVDSEPCVRKFANHWKMDVVIFLESEIWPNFLRYLSKKKIPTYLVNARMSVKSASRWRFFAKFGIRPFDNFKKIFVQDEKDIVTFKSLSSANLEFFGNLKNEAAPPSYDDELLKNLKSRIGKRKIFLVASTHKKEEEVIVSVHKRLKQKYPDLLTVLVVRHPARSNEVEKVLQGLDYATFDQGKKIKDEDELLFVNKMGVLGLFYKFCDFAFIAGSLEKIGGHNPYEAIKLDCAVVTGENYFNFYETYENLKKNNACIVVDGQDSLFEVMDGLFSGKIDAKKMLANAKEAIKKSGSVSDAVIGEVSTVLQGDLISR